MKKKDCETTNTVRWRQSAQFWTCSGREPPLSSREKSILVQRAGLSRWKPQHKPIFFTTESFGLCNFPHLYVIQSCLLALDPPAHLTLVNVLKRRLKCIFSSYLLLINYAMCLTVVSIYYIFAQCHLHILLYYVYPGFPPLTDISWIVKRMTKGTSGLMKSVALYGPRSLWTEKTQPGTTSLWWRRRLVGTQGF